MNRTASSRSGRGARHQARSGRGARHQARSGRGARRQARALLGAVLLAAPLALGACSDGGDDGAPTSASTSAPTSAATPPPTAGTLPPAPDDRRGIPAATGTLPDSVPEIDSAYDYETIPVSTAPLPTVVLPPLEPSPAERMATAPPPTVRVGAVDGDRAAAAPDTRIPVRRTLPDPAPPTTTPLPAVTVADLGLDATAAEQILSRISWPSGLGVVPVGAPDTAGNATANVFAGDPVMLAAIRSAGARLLRRGDDGPAVVASLLLVDRTRLGANPLAVVRRAIRAPQARADLVGTAPALVVDEQGNRTIVAVGTNRVVAAAGPAADEAVIRAVVAALLAA